ncbi:14284_t:CDS:2, partial [Racocetra persica]
IVYQASSPDEGALVKGAMTLDYIFTTRRPNSVNVLINGVDYEYELLNICGFNSTRKRMSIVVRGPDGKITLYCKGADTVILELLSDNNPFVEQTIQHLEDYIADGLRTLFIAMREISDEEYRVWSTVYEKASTSLVDRQEELDKAAEMVEKNLFLLGATAIEDKLQDDVPETISTLQQAGIKIWVLTGDTQENSVQIGFNCKLFNEKTTLILVNEESHWETKEFLERRIQSLKGLVNPDAEPLALAIDGRTLEFALDKEIEGVFLELATMCKAVFCCRVSPLQKANVVKLVRRHLKAILLAIGDGANDVPMIQEAHVGVGIIGLEGTQAARNADYEFQDGFSSQVIYESWTAMYYNNVLFAVFSVAPVLPAVIKGVCDQYISATMLDRYSQIYKYGIESESFNVRNFWRWVLNALFHSLVIYLVSTFIFYDDLVLMNGQIAGHWCWGTAVYTSVLVTVLGKALLITDKWTKYTIIIAIIAVPGSFIFGMVFCFLYNLATSMFKITEEYDNTIPKLLSSPIFYFFILLVPAICLLRDYTWKYISRMYRVRPYHIIQEIQHFNFPDYRPRAEQFSKARRKVRAVNRLRKLRGFAFSQNESGQESRLISLYATTEVIGADIYGFGIIMAEIDYLI